MQGASDHPFAPTLQLNKPGSFSRITNPIHDSVVEQRVNGSPNSAVGSDFCLIFQAIFLCTIFLIQLPTNYLHHVRLNLDSAGPMVAHMSQSQMQKGMRCSTDAT